MSDPLLASSSPTLFAILATHPSVHDNFLSARSFPSEHIQINRVTRNVYSIAWTLFLNYFKGITAVMNPLGSKVFISRPLVYMWLRHKIIFIRHDHRSRANVWLTKPLFVDLHPHFCSLLIPARCSHLDVYFSQLSSLSVFS